MASATVLRAKALRDLSRVLRLPRLTRSPIVCAFPAPHIHLHHPVFATSFLTFTIRNSTTETTKSTEFAPVNDNWTEEEDDKVWEAVEMYGNEEECWDDVARNVGTRGPDECRKRYNDVLVPNINGAKKREELRKQAEEIEKKREGAMEPGESTEKATAETNKVGKGRWSEEEDKNLLKGVRMYGEDWEAVAQLVGSRSRDSCRDRFRKLVDSGEVVVEEQETKPKKTKQDAVEIREGEGAVEPGESTEKAAATTATKVRSPTWSEEEDTKLVKGVRKYGEDWDAVAQLVGSRSRMFCRTRFRKLVDLGEVVVEEQEPKPKKKKQNAASPSKSASEKSPTKATKYREDLWTEEEDQKLLKGFKKFGEDWASVASHVGTHSPHQCRQRYQRGLPRMGLVDEENRARGRWTEEEDARLRKGLRVHGVGKWVALARDVGTRTADQVETRYRKVLLPRIKAEKEAKLNSKKSSAATTSKSSKNKPTASITKSEPTKKQNASDGKAKAKKTEKFQSGKGMLGSKGGQGDLAKIERDLASIKASFEMLTRVVQRVFPKTLWGNDKRK
ncbi:hypothetical protein HK102_006639 [Quaeritorhiza haematococci]|nr:hypothetical protein HK102_006639 [Quaeritorhiza haematococci]